MPAPKPSRSPARIRLLVLSAALAGVAVVARAMLSPHPLNLADHLGGLLLASFAVLLLGSFYARLRKLWHMHLHGALARLGSGLWAFSERWWPHSEPEPEPVRPRLGGGERIALVAGLLLCALDVALTTLLLRDVFPEPPYRFELFGLLSPGASEWSFYVAVALFKTLLELWFGVFDKIRSAIAGPSAMRWFVLGGASAFDAALAAARGMLLAEQGMGGSAVTVSNIVFIGFGIAVPWVAAHTGGLLVGAVDGFLARLGLLRWLAAVPRLALLLTLWLAVIAVSLPLGAVLLACGCFGLVWRALDDIVATILNHDNHDSSDLDHTLTLTAHAQVNDSTGTPTSSGLQRATGGVA